MKPALTLFCDFDGTITKKDTIDYLLTCLADPAWTEIEARWVSGEIGSRDCMAQQIPLIRGGWQAIQDVLDTVEIDPTFPAFVSWAKKHGFPLVVVSEGISQVIRYILNRHEIIVDGIWANQLEFLPNDQLALSFPFAPRQFSCKAGLCKCQILDQAPARSTTVVIGDGFSDRCWAAEADMLFAKAKLLTYCKENGIAHQPFEDFKVVQMALETSLFTLTPSSPQQPELSFHAQPQRHASRFAS